MTEQQVFQDLIGTVGLSEEEFGELYAELIQQNAGAQTQDMTPDEATMANCSNAINWLRENIQEEKWQRFAAVMTVLAIVMSEAQAAMMGSMDQPSI